jgi:lysozyme family protein
MADRFLSCLDVVLGYEGGFVDDPRDPGGATNFGVTRGTLGHWLGRVATVHEVRDLQRETAAEIYRAHFWHVVGCDQLPAGVDLILFDCAVNQGTTFAGRTLQTALGINADGIVGPRTIAAAQSDNPARLIRCISALRRERYVSLPTFDRFGRGWLRRLDTVTAKAIGLTTA